MSEVINVKVCRTCKQLKPAAVMVDLVLAVCPECHAYSNYRFDQLQAHQYDNRAASSAVYFVQGVKANGDYFGLIKIGYTADPAARVSVLNSQLRRNVEYLGLEMGHRDREKELHAKFAKYRVWREWFKPARPLIRYIFNNTLGYDEFIELRREQFKANWQWINAILPEITPPTPPIASAQAA